MSNALKSLYGEGHQKANANRARDALCMAGVRNQVVISPSVIVGPGQGLASFWPCGVAYDPCDGPGSLVGAARSTRTRGLLDPWVDRTYANPPFGTSLRDPENELPDYMREVALREEELKNAKQAGRKPRTPKWPKGSGLPVKKAGLRDWLEHHIAQKAVGETVLLAPMRTNRVWFVAWLEQLDCFVLSKPIAFDGQKQSYPAPVVIGLLGATPARRLDFAQAFAHIGRTFSLKETKT